VVARPLRIGLLARGLAAVPAPEYEIAIAAVVFSLPREQDQKPFEAFTLFYH
jgi:hypothetical protein